MTHVTVNDPGVIPFPAEREERYRELGLWRDVTLPGALDEAAERYGSDTFVVDRSRSLSFREVAESSRRCGVWLRAQGVCPGDNVLVYLPNSVAWVEVYFGIMRAGARPVMALSSHGRVELAHVARKAGACAIVTTGRVGLTDYGATVRAVEGSLGEDRSVDDRLMAVGVIEVAVDGLRPWDECRYDGGLPRAASGDVAVLQLSGGTTGNPKLIPRLHADYEYSSRVAAEVCGLGHGDVMLIVLPVSHNFVQTSPGLLGAMAVGATVVLAPDPSPSTGFGLLDSHGVTHVALVPALLLSWMNSVQAGESEHAALRTVWVGGAKLSRAVAVRVEGELGCSLQQVFGMAEGLCNYTRLGDDVEVVVGTQGRPLSPEDEVRVVDDAGDPVPDGVEGHLQTRGPYTITGYYRAPEHNCRSFTEDGFYISGDLVVRDARGYLTVTGRAKDIINRAGEKVAPESVENTLLAMPEVHDASVVGVPDDVLGEKIVAYVILRDDCGADCRPTPRQFVMRVRRSGIAAFAVPDEVRIVDEFPLTGVGKVSKNRQR
ncbi:(2,3-dihydroxybenzoyl)adenylate synthase [Corynebacterium kroppenstedtii]|uniref:(2,3-dihydroxybenzoyl)adenylate synthase n=1 Tax=Corynebacterium sp. PCR 32 TaxID=3351342 RepID=UPI0030B4484D